MDPLAVVPMDPLNAVMSPLDNVVSVPVQPQTVANLVAVVATVPPTLTDTHLFIFLASFIGIAFAIYQFTIIKKIPVVNNPNNKDYWEESELDLIFNIVTQGAKSFLWAEYKICFMFIVVFGAIVLILVAHPWHGAVWLEGVLTCLSFVVGSLTSILSGYIGMMVAVYSNARTAICASAGGENSPSKGWTDSFNCAFRAGNVMGFSLCGLSLVILYIMCLIYRQIFGIQGLYAGGGNNVVVLFECIAGYGLGGSSIAMFGRVGGGIFTKAADVGADLAGKVIGVKDKDGNKRKLDEDSPYNPACVADNVGDNVGDVAGMGSDLFGSFGEASCAALLVGSSVVAIGGNGTTSPAVWAYLMFPLTVSAAGILVCLICTFVATHVHPVRKEKDVETVLKIQLLLTSIVLSGVMYPVAIYFLPSEMNFISGGGTKVNLINVEPWVPYTCVLAGLWGGCIIGFMTEYFTSHSYQPVRDVARSTETGAATNIIYGLALGYKSVILPAIIIAIIIFIAFRSCGMYGIALGALGMLSTLATCLSIDVYGPVCDNAGGIAEMVHMPSWVRDKTDALDAAGNTTAAIGKGFAIGSAALVSLALFGAFITRAQNSMSNGQVVNLSMLQPIVFAFLLFGAMVPYWFSAMTMRSVGEAANKMVLEVDRQFSSNTRLQAVATMDDRKELEAYLKTENVKITDCLPDYDECIKIATEASLREMIPPGLLVITTPIIVGILFGIEAVAGLLGGALVSSVQLAISMSNTGGAWDNAKKYCEKGELNGYFKFDRTKSYGSFNHSKGNDAFSQKQNIGNGKGLNDWLSGIEKADKKLYEDIMTGKQPIIHNDHKESNGDEIYRKFKYAGKKSEAHSACVTGDTVGDPLKDTSGPALNIVMKLMAIISVVFADTFISINGGMGIFNIQPVA